MSVAVGRVVAFSTQRARMASKDYPVTAEGRRLDMRRLLVALKLDSVDYLLYYMQESPIKEPLHPLIADRIISGSECTCRISREDTARNGKRVFVRHFSPEFTSKRLIHVGLLWVSLLGPNYPFGERLLREVVWKSLVNVCGNGINHRNAHGPVLCGPVCMAPYHYRMPLKPSICKVLFDDFHSLVEHVKEFSAWRESGPVAAFMDKLSARVRPCRRIAQDERLEEPRSDKSDLDQERRKTRCQARTFE